MNEAETPARTPTRGDPGSGGGFGFGEGQENWQQETAIAPSDHKIRQRGYYRDCVAFGVNRYSGSNAAVVATRPQSAGLMRDVSQLDAVNLASKSL